MVDYSKWKDIEISDDEDETHPNIDTPSLFRWRHQARVERMAEFDKEKEDVENKKKQTEKKLKEVKEKLTTADTSSTDVDSLKKSLQELEMENDKIAKKKEEILKKEKSEKWNVDTISKPGFEKTVINKKPEPPKYENMSEEEKEAKMKQYIKDNEKLLKKYGMLRKYDDSKQFLSENSHLACEDTANYLVIWCIQLEMEEKHELMQHVAHQCICMQYILDLAKQLNVDPRACVASFFTRIQVAEPLYKTEFKNELDGFKARIKKRAAEKVAEALAEQEEEERQARLGPGGLDPVEVFEALPDVLKQCFESRDIKSLQDAITQMPEEEAKYHMKRCVDSGLWVPEAGKKDKGEGDNAEVEADATTTTSEEEPLYDTAKSSTATASINDLD